MKIKNIIILKNFTHLSIFLILYLSVIFGYYFNEDSLGGATDDAIHHFKIAQKFNSNFYETLLNFGNSDYDLATRNSPVFWIFISILNKYFTYDTIRFLNTFVIFTIAIVFYKCLLIKFKEIDDKNILFLSSFLFLSPSLRSLAIWPYSLIWGLFFFIISIYLYLKFKENFEFKNSFLILCLLIISSYIYPSFSVFYIFYIFNIFKFTKNIILILKLLLTSFVLSIPCLIYLFFTDFISIFQNTQGFETSWSQSFNISNKILIISTIILYLIMPLIKFREVANKIIKLQVNEIVLVFLFCLINIYFFNFINGPWGGGFFYKISNIFFLNNFLFFLFAIISIFLIYVLLNKNLNNYLLVGILILYNPQFTIYLKYFDPLIFILFLTLFDFNLKKHFIEKTYAVTQFYGVILFYYTVIYFKNLF